jgi:uncharacterized iron-regulated protein
MIMKLKSIFTGVFATALLAGCHAAAKDSAETGMLLSDNSLVDKIWQVSEKRFVSKRQLLNNIVNHNYILLGETHDNPLHHNYQAWVIQQLHNQGRQVAVAFEMITPEQEQILKKHAVQSAEEIFDLLDWEKSGWPSRDIYKPVFETALNANDSIVAANIARKELNQIVMQGNSEVPAAIMAQLDENPMNKEAEAMLRTEIEESHCRMLPEAMVPAMMLGQRVRDAVIANSLVANKQTDGIVLIAGSGHTQKNGVPVFIHSADPSAKVFSMAWMEVDQRLSKPEQYAQYWGSEDLPFDYVWFTARIDRPDPCEELKKHHQFIKESLKNKESSNTEATK